VFRLVIDVVLGEDLKLAQEEAKYIVENIKDAFGNYASHEVFTVQYRLSRDEDRTIRNYLDLDAEGHASTKKTKMF
jgi:hypothetical protein